MAEHPQFGIRLRPHPVDELCIRVGAADDHAELRRMPGQAGDRELYPDEVVGAVLVKADDGESVGVHLFLHLASPGSG